MRTKYNKISESIFFTHKRNWTSYLHFGFFLLSFSRCLSVRCIGVATYDTNWSDEIIFLTFSLHSRSGSAEWISKIAFPNITSSTLNGVRVEISAYLKKWKTTQNELNIDSDL